MHERTSGELLERADVLGTVGALVDRARRGRGAAVLLSGPAGIGKSSVARAVLEGATPSLRTWVGRCDPLAAPIPLAPLADIATRERRVRDLLDELAPNAVGPALVRTLARPTVLVVEDVHWMDEATADLLVHVMRRAERTRSVLLVTFRDDPPDHTPTLARVLDAVATAGHIHRHVLPPLSLAAVRRLAEGTDSDPEDVHRRTGGNPFFVTEVLAMPDRPVPPSVAEAVRSRASRLSGDGRALLDLLAVTPGGLEVDLATAILGSEVSLRGLDAAVEHQMVVIEDGWVRFRHDLARSAIAEALAPSRRLDLHRCVLEALERIAEDPVARLAHHAVALGDAARIRRYAPAAAEVALDRGAWRSAAAHLRAVLDRGDVVLGAVERAELLEQLAHAQAQELSPSEHVEANLRAADAWEAAGAPARQALMLVRASAAHHRAAEPDASWRLLHRARELTDGLSMDEAVAEVESEYLSRLGMLGDLTATADYAEVLLPRLEGVDAPRALSDALVFRGLCRILGDDPEGGIADGWRAIDVAGAGARDLAAQHALNVAEALVEARRPGDALAFVARGKAFAAERDQPLHLAYLIAIGAHAYLRSGEVAAARREADEAREVHDGGLSEIVRGTVVSRCLAWAGHGDAAATVLDETTARVGGMDDLPFLGPLAAARAELAWFQDDLETIPAVTDSALRLARERHHPWVAGELLYWRSLAAGAGIDDGPPPAWVAEPWGLMLARRWSEAAAAWEQRGCPYERALALASGDLDEQRTALEILTDIGAVPAADRVREALRAAGAAGVPARPRRHGRELTDRQHEVLALLAEGLTNVEIGRRLRISPKTAEHHVCAILERLGVATRAEAAAEAMRRRLVAGADPGDLVR